MKRRNRGRGKGFLSSMLRHINQDPPSCIKQVHSYLTNRSSFYHSSLLWLQNSIYGLLAKRMLSLIAPGVRAKHVCSSQLQRIHRITLTELCKLTITGASEGAIGAATAIALAHGKPRTLFFTCRDPSKTAPVIEDIRKSI